MNLDAPADILFAIMYDWMDDDSVPDGVTFDEWAREHRPDLIPLLDSIPPSSRPMPTIDPDEEDEGA